MIETFHCQRCGMKLSSLGGLYCSADCMAVHHGVLPETVKAMPECLAVVAANAPRIAIHSAWFWGHLYPKILAEEILSEAEIDWAKRRLDQRQAGELKMPPDVQTAYDAETIKVIACEAKCVEALRARRVQ